jgi:hypothetical protein
MYPKNNCYNNFNFIRLHNKINQDKLHLNDVISTVPSLFIFIDLILIFFSLNKLYYIHI